MESVSSDYSVLLYGIKSFHSVVSIPLWIPVFLSVTVLLLCFHSLSGLEGQFQWHRR